MSTQQHQTYDYVVIGSGFGGSVSALRLAEKGYSVLVIERGKHYRDEDFARTNWNIWKYLWRPALRCFGILEMSLLDGVMVLRGCGVGGGSLGYANVLMEPDDQLFSAPGWCDMADWKTILRPHFDTARRMLGVAQNPRLWSADTYIAQIAAENGYSNSLRPADVGVFFGDEERDTPDPYFNGAGPVRRGCRHCGGCMVGCRHNAKNTTTKNYLHLAQGLGAEVQAESEAVNIEELPANEPDGARYEVVCKRSTAILPSAPKRIRARNIVLAGGVLGTLKLLFHCRDVSRALPRISRRLGDLVRTNSEALLGAVSRDDIHDFSQGLAITSVAQLDEHTRIEPVRYPVGSSLMRWLSAPLIHMQGNTQTRLLKNLVEIIRHPRDYLHVYLSRRWAQRTTILLVMQTKDNHLRLRLSRKLSTLFRYSLGADHDRGDEQAAQAQIMEAHKAVRSFAQKANAVPASSFFETLLNLPTTAHILGGCPIGLTPEQGVVDLRCRLHGHAGIIVADGSIMPANPGINPSLTITALAEYAMSHVPNRHTP